MASRIYETLKNIEIGRKNCIRNARLANLPATDNMDINSLGNLFLEQNNTEFVNPNDPTVEGYDGEHGGWTRPTDWWDTKTILEEAEPIEQGGVTYYPAYIMLLADWDVSTEVTKTTSNKATQGDAFVFSDEPDTLYVGDQTHTWDTTKDKECSEGYKTRYIIVYVTNKTTNLLITLTQFKLIECIFGEFTSDSFRFGTGTVSTSNQYLINFETLNTFLTKLISYSNTGAFRDCRNLKNINLPTLERVSSQFLYNCYSLLNATIPNLKETTGDSFNACRSLRHIFLPNATTINSSMFQSCPSLTSISLPNVTSIGYSAFSGCTNLVSISLPNVTNISYNAFNYCTSLTSISLPNVTSISYGAFNNCCALNSVSIPNIRELNKSSSSGAIFESCYSLIQLELPSTITSISKIQFTDSRNLRVLLLPNDWNFELDVSPCDMPRDGLLDIISKLKDLTDETAKTFTFGSDNLAKLTNAEIQVATDKNWILN